MRTRHFLALILTASVLAPSASALTVAEERSLVNSVQATDASLPSGVANPKWAVWALLSEIFYGSADGAKNGMIKGQYVDIAGMNIWTQSGANAWYTGTGNVGIGTTLPNRKLHVASATGEDGVTVDAPNFPEIAFYRSWTSKGYVGISWTAGGYNASTLADSLIFRSESAAMHFITNGWATNALTVNGANVGIGTVSPAYKLDVSGDIRATGTVYGNATSANALSNMGSYVWSASALPTSYGMGTQTSFVQGADGFPNYGSLMTMRTYSGGGGTLQLYTPYSPTYGGTGLQVRFGNYDVSTGNSWTAWKTLLASDNYNSYAPTLTWGGASGTWGISVTGSAWSVPWSGVAGKPTTVAGYGITDFVSSNSGSPVAADSTATNGHYYVNSNISQFGQTDGALYVQSYSPSWVGQIFQDYRTGQLGIRGKNNGTWQGWRTVLDSSNYSGYAMPASGGIGDYDLANNSNGCTSYGCATLELREANRGATGGYTPPHLGFHWGWVVASQIGIESSGRITILNNPGTAYENLAANNVYAGGGISDSAGSRMDSGGGWIRTYGDTGWYNGTYAGGWYMSDTTWIRAYNSKSVYTPGEMQASTVRANSNLCIGSDCRSSWPSNSDPFVATVRAGVPELPSNWPALIVCNSASDSTTLLFPYYHARYNASYFMCWGAGGSFCLNSSGAFTWGGCGSATSLSNLCNAPNKCFY